MAGYPSSGALATTSAVSPAKPSVGASHPQPKLRLASNSPSLECARRPNHSPMASVPAEQHGGNEPIDGGKGLIHALATPGIRSSWPIAASPPSAVILIP